MATNKSLGWDVSGDKWSVGLAEEEGVGVNMTKDKWLDNARNDGELPTCVQDILSNCSPKNHFN